MFARHSCTIWALASGKHQCRGWSCNNGGCSIRDFVDYPLRTVGVAYSQESTRGTGEQSAQNVWHPCRRPLRCSHWYVFLNRTGHTLSQPTLPRPLDLTLSILMQGSVWVFHLVDVFAGLWIKVQGIPKLETLFPTLSDTQYTQHRSNSSILKHVPIY